jgi:hypothetical protein
MSPLNKSQKKILTIGIIVTLVCCVFPPWVRTYKATSTYSERSIGYALIISPPRAGSSMRVGVKLDTSRLLLQIFIISIATGAGVLLTKRKDE